ncbi:hypothetical protein GCM10028868_12890 [Virgibacillus kimchii]
MFYLITAVCYDILFFGVNTWFVHNGPGKKYTRPGICLDGANDARVSKQYEPAGGKNHKEEERCQQFQ